MVVVVMVVLVVVVVVVCVTGIVVLEFSYGPDFL